MSIKDTNETTEFYNPHLGLDLAPYIQGFSRVANKQSRLIKQGIHHLGRYHWAAKVFRSLKQGKILDIACGTGYGSYIIARDNPNLFVTGADYDERAIEIANSKYKLSNLNYIVANGVRWVDSEGSSLGAFDAVVSFDTIEHLLHRELFMMQLSRGMTSSGFLLFSTPVRKDVVLNPGWEHHKIEYSQEYLLDFMSRYFEVVHSGGTKDLPLANWWDENINFGGETRYLLRANPLACYKPIQFQPVRPINAQNAIKSEG